MLMFGFTKVPTLAAANFVKSCQLPSKHKTVVKLTREVHQLLHELDTTTQVLLYTADPCF